MSAAGKICVGFSHPFVAEYTASGETVTYSKGIQLARGVDVHITPTTSDDNTFYADNVPAESDAGTFNGGSCDLTVDGLLDAAEKLIYGLPAPESVTIGSNKTVNITKFGDALVVPHVGLGFIAHYVSGGVRRYTPVILRKCKFHLPEDEHKTKEKNTNYQPQKLKADILRDDTAKHDWKWKGEDQTTEADAIAVVEAILGKGGAG